jgi:hypothetical protein
MNGYTSVYYSAQNQASDTVNEIGRERVDE